MPIVTTAKRRRQFSGRRDIGIAVEHVRNLVRIFFVHARQGELGESLRRLRVECRCLVFRREGKSRQQTESQNEEFLHWAFDVGR